jgi:hypothetical protein
MRLLAFAAALAVGLPLGGVARAQVSTPGPLSTAPPAAVEAPGPAEPSARPRLSLAVGMGASLDSTGFSDGAHAIPAFFGVGGFGDGLVGFDLGAFSSAASGRFHASSAAPVDRLALDAFAVIRPAAGFRRDDPGYAVRVLHTVAAELGVGFERDGRTNGAGSRFQVHTGARVELPLTPAGRASELRLRLAFRRAVGLYTPRLAGDPVTAVGDSNEVYAALAVVF